MLVQIPGSETVRGVFEDVLAGPDFQPHGMSLAERFVRFVFDALDRIFGWFPALEDSTVRVMAVLMVGAAGVATVALVWQRTTGGARRPPPSPGPRDASGPRTVAEWVAWARGARGDGDLRLAATGLYQAVVLHLEGRGALRYGEWKTPGDYAFEIHGRDEAVPFESFLALFVEIAFGPREPTDDAVDSLFSRADRLGCPT